MKTSSAIFKCKLCPQRFASAGSLRTHSLIHSRDDDFKCRFCPSSFSSWGGLRNHARRAHGISKRNRSCDLCTASFRSNRQLKRHCEAAHSDVNFGCASCGFRCHNRSFLTSHLQVHAASQRYVCNVCNKCFKSQKNLDQHRALHSSVWPFQCSICSLRFAYRWTLTSHLEGHSERSNFSCKDCGRKCVSNEVLARHLSLCCATKVKKQNWRHICRVCNKAFPKRYKLDAHLAVHGGEKTFKCPHCPVAFNSSFTASAHRRTHATTTQVYQCNRCPLKFENLRALNKHAHRCSVNLYQCGVCAEAFRNRKKFTKHVLRHTDVRSYACDLCPLRFALPDGLWQHKRHRHVDEKPFKCGACAKVFKAKKALRAHEAVHQTRKHYGCAHCIGVYRRSKELLRKHLRKHDAAFIESLKCKQCPKQFTDQPSYKDHVRLKHSGAIIEKSFKCDQCPAAFWQNKLLVRHRRCHSEERAFKCLYCTADYKSHSARQQHMLRKHLSEAVPATFKCDQCPAVFRFPSLLKNHLQSRHSNERSFACPHCSATYKGWSARWLHMLTKHSAHYGRPRCAQCGVDFERKLELRMHILRHGLDNARGYRCQHCPACFDLLSNYRRHCRTSRHRFAVQQTHVQLAEQQPSSDDFDFKQIAPRTDAAKRGVAIKAELKRRSSQMTMIY